jgi:hypothetical protein
LLNVPDTASVLVPPAPPVIVATPVTFPV